MPENLVFIGKGSYVQSLLLSRANRHGLIAGATGTGKTVTLQILAEGFSAQGVPVFMADVKGDLSGISQPGTPKPFLTKRAAEVGLEPYLFAGFPTVFWDVFGSQGHPVRATISDMGPLLLSRLLELNDTQEGVLNIAFKLADDHGMALLDLKDLRALMTFVSEQSQELTALYGNVSKASVGAIQRRLLQLEQQGGDQFFGEPALELTDLMRCDAAGRGHINLLAADQLIQRPRLYATVLLWLLAELFEELPEVGDPEKPKLVFFFDEAHLLFEDAPKALLTKVEQVVRLIRSKGVGVYFVSQNPTDIPDKILGQLGNRVQHALRAFTTRDQKAVRAAASTFRENPSLDTEKVITELGIGEALISTLDAKGMPSIVDQTLIRPPSSRLGPATAEERNRILSLSEFGPRYDDVIDRESAYEILQKRAEQAAKEAEQATLDKNRIYEAPASKSKKPAQTRRSSRQGVFETMAKSIARTMGREMTRGILRGVLGSLFKGR
ncbi:helicase HerA-like domain-containing protein [Marinobacter sp. AC-23]|uniref:helicase HerA-like domain-containing protein n=1 Tax=Marinobacter sp. AC-23 TaxID=1879031 RepID=UPI0008DDD891|nr:helicase HerA-like domain-containing protein [Marinobacter sp. AC-23]OHY79286.1 ATP-binding protein [Marinobacter sp. AC-23]